MAPNPNAHGAEPQTSTSPYIVETDVPTGGYTPGKSYTGELNSCHSGCTLIRVDLGQHVFAFCE